MVPNNEQGESPQADMNKTNKWDNMKAEQPSTKLPTLTNISPRKTQIISSPTPINEQGESPLADMNKTNKFDKIQQDQATTKNSISNINTPKKAIIISSPTTQDEDEDEDEETEPEYFKKKLG